VINLVDVESIVGAAPPAEGLAAWFIVLLGTYVATAPFGLAITLFYTLWVFSGGRVPRSSRVPWRRLFSCSTSLRWCRSSGDTCGVTMA
jgi:hypothetical protein